MGREWWGDREKGKRGEGGREKEGTPTFGLHFPYSKSCKNTLRQFAFKVKDQSKMSPESRSRSKVKVNTIGLIVSCNQVRCITAQNCINV